MSFNRLNLGDYKNAFNILRRMPAFAMANGIILGSIITSVIYGTHNVAETVSTETSEMINVVSQELIIKGEYFIKAPHRGAYEEGLHWDANRDGWYSWLEDAFIKLNSDLGYGSVQRMEPFQL